MSAVLRVSLMALTVITGQPSVMSASVTSAVEQAIEPISTPYVMLGSDERLRRLVDAFYDRMDSLPTSHALRAMHAADLGPMREKLFDFLSSWLGGPDRYFVRPDAKCMGSAHAPFDIDAASSAAWLGCMRQALDDIGAPEDFRALVMPAFERMARAMIRRPMP